MKLQRDSEIKVRKRFIKVDRGGCRNTEYITIPYSNDSRNIKYGWLVSYCTGVPTQNAKSLAHTL